VLKSRELEPERLPARTGADLHNPVPRQLDLLELVELQALRRPCLKSWRKFVTWQWIYEGSPWQATAAGYRRPVSAEDTRSPEDARSLVSDLTAAVRPFDEREAADQADVMAWVASGQPLFRTAAPATPPKHLVVYFVPADTANRSLLLGDHRKSGLWLPPGGHVEDGEDPRQAVVREAREELGITAEFHPGLGAARPFFLTVTPTNEPGSHLDVSMWFVIQLDRAAGLVPDPREFSAACWFDLDEQRDWPPGTYDPEMGRFAAKLRSALGDRDDLAAAIG
jgi:8-oxo-dGTP diphosphatase